MLKQKFHSKYSMVYRKYMTLKYVVIGTIIATLLSSGSIAAAFASGLGPHDFDEHPEDVCIKYANDPEMEDICSDINICDEEGEINSTHGFCTGEIVPYLPGFSGCPEGYHSYDDDESGYCYDNDLGCQYEDMIMRPDQRSCGYIESVCEEYPDLEGCTVTRFLGVPDNPDSSNCEQSVPDHCIEPYVERGYTSNGTWIKGNDLSCHGIKPLSDFRVTADDTRRHHFNGDYDGIGCENNDN
jgi:hypothetical protein